MTWAKSAFDSTIELNWPRNVTKRYFFSMISSNFLCINFLSTRAVAVFRSFIYFLFFVCLLVFMLKFASLFVIISITDEVILFFVQKSQSFHSCSDLSCKLVSTGRESVWKMMNDSLTFLNETISIESNRKKSPHLNLALDHFQLNGIHHFVSFVTCCK